MEVNEFTPTLDEFLTWRRPNNAYIRYPGFKNLYLRKGPVLVRFGGCSYICENVIQIANVQATCPGKGAFKSLVRDLVNRGKAIYVECVHTPYFQEKLIEWGFIRVNEREGDHYLYNHEGCLTNARQETPESVAMQADSP